LKEVAMRILMVEDNRSYGEYLYETLSKIGDTTWLVSEREFAESFELMETEPPDVAVIDSMLRWDVPRPPGQRSDDRKDLYTAGIRCAGRLAESPRTAHVRVLLLTVIDKEDLEKKVSQLPPNVTYFRKQTDLSDIVRAVREAGSLGRP